MFFCELIETLWNVNQITPQTISRGLRELIETLWNVNVVNMTYFYSGKIELIETLWNVNNRSVFVLSVTSGN